ncbi:MAG: AraC family transcriptional regulator ligand-binding domain-containing protein, partial [Myxococcota bacterium]
MNAEPMVALTVCRTVLDTAKQLDIDICSLALEAGADPAVFDSIDGRIPTRAYIALFEGAQSRSGRADFALEVGRRFRPGTPHGVGQATKRARNLQEAWRYLAHYWRLVAEGTAFRLVAEEPTPPDSTAS